MIGYKAFDENLKCRGFQFKVGKTYKTKAKKEELELCTDTVFHFCLDIFLSTDGIKQLNEKMNDVEEHTGFDEVEGNFIKLTPDKNSKFELRRIN